VSFVVVVVVVVDGCGRVAIKVVGRGMEIIHAAMVFLSFVVVIHANMKKKYKKEG